MRRRWSGGGGEGRTEVSEGRGHAFVNSWFFILRVFCQLEMSDYLSSAILFLLKKEGKDTFAAPDALGLGSVQRSVLCLEQPRLVSWLLHGPD